jgi:hypothetical protein
MSKKHFIALADQIIIENKYGQHKFSTGQLEFLANFCQSQNSAFNRERWLDYIAGKCGPNGGAR